MQHDIVVSDAIRTVVLRQSFFHAGTVCFSCATLYETGKVCVATLLYTWGLSC